MDPTSEFPKYLSIDGEIARYAPTVEVPLDAAVEMISRAIEYCREHDIGGLLVDARELYGFPHPSVVDRYWFIRKWAAAAAGDVVMSFIQRPEMIDKDQIGITMASNAGMIVNISDNDADALSWLLANIRAKAPA